MYPIVLSAALAFLLPVSALAQTEDRPSRTRLEATGGYAGFADDALIDHAVIGGAMRFYVSRRLSVGPEVTYMVGPGSDRDLMLTGNVTFDLLRSPDDRARRVMPFIVGGAGLFRSTRRFGQTSYSSTEGAFTGGTGVRVQLTDRLYVAPDFRLGWELHFRITATIGVALR